MQPSADSPNFPEPSRSPARAAAAPSQDRIAGQGNRLCLLLLLALTALPFLPALRFGFVVDDDLMVLDNPTTRSWRSLPSYFTSPTLAKPGAASETNFYRPLLWMWFWVNSRLFGVNSFGWHLSTLLAHLGATTLVWLLLRRHFRDPWIAAAAALLFAVHPARLETAVWVSGVGDSLLGLGLLGSLLLWLRSREQAPGRNRGLLAASLACYSAALLSKETSIVFPAILFAYACFYAPQDAPQPPLTLRRLWDALRGVAPFALATAAYFGARAGVLGVVTSWKEWAGPATAFFTSPSLLWFYLRHMFWPRRLSLIYGLDVVRGASPARFWLPLMGLLLLAAGAWLAWRRRRAQWIPLAAAWFLFPLVPVLNIGAFQPDDFAHDRYIYLSSLALSLLCGALLLAAARRSGRWRLLALAVAAALAVGLGISTAAQSATWQDNLSVYSHVIEQAPHNTLVRNNLATQYVLHGRPEEARVLYAALLAEHPDSWLANYNFGYVNYHLKRLDLAEQFLRRAIALDPADADQYSYLGMTYFREGRLAEAAAQLRLAIARKPAGAGYHIALGLALLQLGERNAAKAAFLEELRYHPDSQTARRQLALLEQAPASAPSSPSR